MVAAYLIWADARLADNAMREMLLKETILDDGRNAIKPTKK